MAKNLGEVINKIMEDNSSKRVLFLTNHLQILGTIHEYYEKCESCHDCLIGLKDVDIARIEDVCGCDSEGCECNLNQYTHYNWFNISANAVVGFSILSDI